MAEPIGGVYVVIDGDYAPLIKALQEAEKAGKASAEKFGQDWGKLGSQLESLGSSFSSLGATLTAAITLPLVGVSTAALLVSGSLEQASVAFKTLLGSAIQAQNHLDELKKFALSTPFEFPDLVSASKRLQALGFTAQEIIPTLTAVGNAAAALGTGALGIERITLALGQMQAKGKVSAGEMKQLAEAGIPAWQILADAISKAEGKIVSVSQVMKRSEDGFIDGNMAVTALIEGMQKKFAGLMEAQAKTLLGIWSNFKDQVTFVLGDIGDALAPLAKQMLGQFSEVLKTINVLVAEFKKLPVEVQGAVVGFAALAAAAGPVLFIVGQLTSAVGSIISLWTTLGLSMGAVTAVAVPVAAALATIGASIAAIHFTGLDDEVMHFVSTVKNNFSGIISLFSDVGDGARNLIKAFEDLAGTGPILENIAFGFKSMDLSWRSFFTASMPQFAMLRDALAVISPVVERIGGSYQSMAVAAKLQLGNLDAAHADLNQKVAEGAGAYDALAKTGTKRLADLSAAAEAYAKKIAAAFGEIGLKDTTLEIKNLQAAYVLLAKSGRLTAEQLKDAQAQVHFKIQQLIYDVPDYIEANRKAEEAIIDVMRKTREDAEKTGKAFKDHWDEYVKGAQKAANVQTPIKFNAQEILDNARNLQVGDTAALGDKPGSLGAIGLRLPESLGPSLKELSEDALALVRAMDKLGISADKSGVIMTENLLAFQTMATSGKNSLEQIEVAWSRVSGEVERISKENLPLAIKLTQDYIDLLKAAGAAAGKIYTEEIKKLDYIIHGKELAGKDATKEIVQMDAKIRKMKELTDAARRLGDMYVQIRNEFDKLFDARQLLETLGSALFDTSKNDELRESIKGLNQDLADAALKWGEVQREAAVALEEIIADHAKAQQRIQEDAARSFRDATIDYRRFVEDAREDLAKAQREGDAEQVREIQKQLRRRAEDYAIYVSDLKKATAQKLADDKEAQAKETKAVQDNLAQQKVAYDQFVAATAAKINELTEAMTNAFERMGNAFRDMLKGFVTEVGKLVASTILQGYLDSLKKKITSALFPDLDEGGVPGGGLLSKIIGKGGSNASPVNVPGGMPPGGDVDFSSVGGTNSSIAAQGIGSTIGTALGTGGDVAAIATAAMTAYMLVVLKRIEKDIARMEVTTRGMLNQLISLQGTFNTYLPQIADRTLGIWGELINVVEILRILGQAGGFGGGKDVGQLIADSINSRAHVTESSGMQEILNVQQQSINAANEYNLALQTTTSTAYDLENAVSGTTDGLYYLNEAVTGLAGALPGFTDEMDRAVFNSMAGQQGKPGQNLSPGGPRMNMTPIIMPVPTMDAITGNGGLMQGSMMSHQNTQLSYPTIAPVVGGPGVTRQGAATVYVTAVDPTSRSVTQGIVTGLEEVGIRVR